VSGPKSFVFKQQPHFPDLLVFVF